jgi:hypothetical protein
VREQDEAFRLNDTAAVTQHLAGLADPMPIIIPNHRENGN